MLTCGIAGIGHLGRALSQQFEKEGIDVRAYHPNLERRTEFASDFERVTAVDLSELLKQEIVLLAIPAEAIYPFFKKIKAENIGSGERPTFINLSTLIETKKVQKDFPEFQILGVKMVGHADYLYEYGDGIFITETSMETGKLRKVRCLFEKIGRLFEDDENIVKKVNGLAVRLIIEACIKFEKETEGYLEEYREKAMDTIFPNTMKLFREGSIDGFMKRVIDEINLVNK